MYMKQNLRYIWAINDNDLMEKLLNFLSEVDDNFFTPLHERISLKDYAMKLAKNADNLFVISGKKQIVASCSVYCNAEEAYISSIAVKSAYMRHGIASKMIKMSCERANNRNCKTIALSVSKKNLPAINLYTKHNFILRKELLGELVMMKSIRY